MQTEVDWQSSKEIAGLMGTNKECYLNSFHAMARYPNSHYVEGFVAIRLNAEDESYFPMLFNHAWIEVDGKVIDATPCFTEDRGNVYFPAVKFNAQELASVIAEMESPTLPICEFEYFRPKTPCGQAMIEAKEDGERFIYGTTVREMFNLENPQPKIKWGVGTPQVDEKYWGGHSWVEKWEVESSSSDNVYTVARDDQGRYGCSCPAWTFRRLECKHIRKIKAQQGENPGPGRWQKPTKVQSVVFSAKDWTVAKAKDWLRKHRFKYGKVDETPNEIRFRQFDPGHFTKGHFRSIPFGKGRGIRAIVAEPNPKTKKKALITWIPGTTRYAVTVIHEDGKQTKHDFENDDGLVEGLWGLWHGFFMDNDKTKDFCPITTEWVSPGMANPQRKWGSLGLKYDMPPQKKAPERRFLHHCPPMKDDGKTRRVDKKGLAILKECQKRIVQTKDLHTVPIKDEKGNVIRREYTSKRLELHKEIVDHILDGVECISSFDRPVAILTGGPPGSGKTRYIHEHFPWADKEKTKGVLHIDADYIRSMLPEYEGWNASATHEETSDIVNQIIDNIGQPCRTDIVYDGTMSNIGKYQKLIAKLKEMGYLVFFIFMEVKSSNTTFQRVKDRYVKGGRWVPPFVIRDAHAKADKTFNFLTSLADGYMKIDGTSPMDDKGNIHWQPAPEKKGQPSEYGMEIPKIRPYWPKHPVEENPKQIYEGFVTKAISKTFSWGERWMVFVSLDAGQEVRLSVTPTKDRKLPDYGDVIVFSYHHINNGWWNVTASCEFKIKEKASGLEYRETGTVERVSAVKTDGYAKWFWCLVKSDKTNQMRSFNVYFGKTTESDIKDNYKPWIGEKVEYSIVDIPGKTDFVIEDGTETNRWRVLIDHEARDKRSSDFREEKRKEYEAKRFEQKEEERKKKHEDRETKKRLWMGMGFTLEEATKLATLDMKKLVHLFSMVLRGPCEVGRGGKQAHEYDLGYPGTGLRAPRMPFWGLPSSQRRHYIDVLEKLGLISVSREGEEHKWVLTITEKGKNILELKSNPITWIEEDDEEEFWNEDALGIPDVWWTKGTEWEKYPDKQSIYAEVTVGKLFGGMAVIKYERKRGIVCNLCQNKIVGETEIDVEYNGVKQMFAYHPECQKRFAEEHPEIERTMNSTMGFLAENRGWCWLFPRRKMSKEYD